MTDIDIVDELRGFAEWWRQNPQNSDVIYALARIDGERSVTASGLDRAADEIERLRATPPFRPPSKKERDQVRRKLTDLDELREEVERLRGEGLPNPKAGCACHPHWQDAGGGYTEFVPEYEPACPEHSEHLYDPTTGEWVFRGEGEWEYTWSGEDWILDDEVFPSPQVAENWIGLLSTRRWVREEGGHLVRRRAAGPWEPIPEGETDD